MCLSVCLCVCVPTCIDVRLFVRMCLCACVCVLVHACVLLQNPGKQGQEIQSSTAELITGLVQLVPLASMGEIAQEAMEVRPSSALVCAVSV